jgi:tetratricopeptide (TPR) repeat protein
MKLTTTLCIAAAVYHLGGVAFADNKKADELFKQAKKLMADKRYADACPKFEESYKLDPGIGGELNIARCYEEWGKLGRAYRAYVEAEKQAKDAGDSRQAKIHEFVVAIMPQVPKLVIHVLKDAETDGLKVSIDGTVVDPDDLANPQLVDPGPKQVEYSLASGFKKSALVPVERGGTNEITLELPKAKKVDKPIDKHDKDVDKPVADAHPGRSQRIAGIAIGGVGVVAIGVSTAMTLSARGKYNDALAAHCNGMTDMCDAQGLTDTHDARSTANTATIVFSVGLAAVAGGVVVYLLAPKGEPRASEHAYYVVPTITTEGGGVAFGGRL